MAGDVSEERELASTASTGSRHVVIVADVGGDDFHIGDEAMLVANLAGLRRHVDNSTTVVGRPDAGTDPSAILEGAHGLFISGGGNLSSSWPLLLHQRIALINEAVRRGLPVVASGQTIGPVLEPLDREALTSALRALDHLGVRELSSAAMGIQLGVPPERLHYQVDDAFLLEGRQPADAVSEIVREPFLAVTLDPAFGAIGEWRALHDLSRQLVAAASRRQLRIVFVPHVGRFGRVGTEDGVIGEKLAAVASAEGSAASVLPVLRPEEAVWVTQQAAAVVSSRYHPIVFGTAAEVPCIGIHRDDYTETKLRGALTHVGMASWQLDADSAADGGLQEMFDHLWEQRNELRCTMRSAREQAVEWELGRWPLLLERLGLGGAGSPSPTGGALGRPAAKLAVAALEATRRGAAEVRRPRARRTYITDDQWDRYGRAGYLCLGRLVDGAALATLRQRADDLATGVIRNPAVQLQLDTGGDYDALPEAVSTLDGSLLYRKVQGLEHDELFAPLLRHPRFLEICDRQYGPHAPISIFRAMVMNKPAGQGTFLPWHQDGGDVWALDRDPLVTIWVAVDNATLENGCLEVVEGSHRLGLLSASGSTLSKEQATIHCHSDRVRPLELEAGDAVVMHNWLIHRSGVNPSSHPRRAFTACFMDGRTQSTLTGGHFPLIRGSLAADGYAYRRQLDTELAHWRTSFACAEEYALSLRSEVDRLQEMRAEAERYAKSLEAALARHE